MFIIWGVKTYITGCTSSRGVASTETMETSLGLFLKAIFIGFQKKKKIENQTKIGRDRGDFLNLVSAW